VITAVDTNVLLDALAGDPLHGRSALDHLEAASQQGSLVACEVVVAELAAQFRDTASVQAVLGQLGITLAPMGEAAALGAGFAWGEYRRRGGPRTQLVADFLVGAHARHQADALLSRDRGFIRSYFSDLRLIDPSLAG
jgi:predicted nucleic acid-binding protein